MRFLNSLIPLLIPGVLAASGAGYSIIGEKGSWPQILSSIGLLASAEPAVLVARGGTAADPSWERKVQAGAFLIFDGESPLAASFGFQPGAKTISVAAMTDVHLPKLPLILEQPVSIAEIALPSEARVFTRDARSRTPIVAGVKHGKGGILWLGANPGKLGYERFPYLLQALADLGFEPPFQSRRTWAFFDYSYRTRVDLDYFAVKWRAAGISALHVAGWHFYEPDPERDRYLQHLIEACHREGILVYAWLELPHVSEKFWNDHPEWREQTAGLQDAALDWRKLMNLGEPACFRAASLGVSALVRRFDWDGVNLAELYYESLEGAANPSRFTPMNTVVRADFKKLHNFDPATLWSTRKDAASLRTFLDYRSSLARRMQEEWLAEIEKCRAFHPDLDIVLTHVDDRLDTGMTDAIGADSARVLPLLEKHNFTFLVEDPATVWHLGPARYAEIARRYPASPSLAIDINIAERYQDVYPTKQQTGTELFELVHQASASFPRVALYFENSILAPDMNLLSAAGAVVTRYEWAGKELLVDSTTGFSMRWDGKMTLDGISWPVFNGLSVAIPRGSHTVRRSELSTPIHLTDFNGDISSAQGVAGGLEFNYSSTSRALARLDCPVQQLWIDGHVEPIHQSGGTLLLPAGKRHAVALCK